MQKSSLAAKKINNAQIYYQHQLRRNRSLNARYLSLQVLCLQQYFRNKKNLNNNELKKTESCGNLHPDPSNSGAQLPYPRIAISELQFTRISNQLVASQKNLTAFKFLDQSNTQVHGEAPYCYRLYDRFEQKGFKQAENVFQQINRAPSLEDSNVVLLHFAGKDFLSLRNRKNVNFNIFAQNHPNSLVRCGNNLRSVRSQSRDERRVRQTTEQFGEFPEWPQLLAFNCSR